MDLIGVFVLGTEILHFVTQDAKLVALFLPMVLLIEAPVTLLVIFGMLKWRWSQDSVAQTRIQPKVSCIITCYSEGDAIFKTILSFCEQTYKGHLEVIPIIDGAGQNMDTYEAALRSIDLAKDYPNRTIKIVPKWQRGGRVSALNAGLHAATGDIVLNADGDTSFDVDAVCEMIRGFEDPNVPAVGGALRVRNLNENLITRMQGMEYMISMQGGKVGLSEWNLINNVSGAFGAFRRNFLINIGGWDTHTAEDLDLTVRIKQYFSRYPKMRIPFAVRAIGHTDVPATATELFNQRLRWDGDLVFLYLRKHKYAFSPSLMGWKTVIYTLVYGVLQNVILPVLVVLFNLWLLWTYPLVFVLAVLGIQYLMYFILATLLFFAFLAAVSERPRADIRMAIWLPLYPIYSFVMRLVTAFSVLNEVFRRGHEESNMAPWWVLRRGKRF